MPAHTITEGRFVVKINSFGDEVVNEAGWLGLYAGPQRAPIHSVLTPADTDRHLRILWRSVIQIIIYRKWIFTTGKQDFVICWQPN